MWIFFPIRTWALTCQFVDYEPEIITSRVHDLQSLQAANPKWKDINFIRYFQSQVVFPNKILFFFIMSKKTSIAFPSSSVFQVSNVSSWSN